MVGCLLIAGVAFGAVAAISGCGSSSPTGEPPGQESGQTSGSLSPMMEAYYRAHPRLVDGPLRPAPTTPDKIVADIRAGLDADEGIWLPDYLPDGFALAAPYNGVGSGSVYPNPYVCGVAYGITYTDGVGYIMVMKNSEDDLTQGEWAPLKETLAGRHLRVHEGAEVTLVATAADGDVPLLVAGSGFGADRLAEELTKVAASLSSR